MENRKILLKMLPFLAVLTVFFGLYAYLPSTGVSVYLSPDETATATVATELATHGRAFLTSPLAATYPWLHARSWVSQADRLVPVGFLGWPWFCGFFVRLLGTGILPWIGLVLVLLSLPAFFRILERRFGTVAAWMGTFVTYGFPGIILYANRGLFANVPILAVAIIGLALLDEMKRDATDKPWILRHLFFIFGIFLGLAVAFRPVELGWILPWWIWMGWGIKWNVKRVLAVVLGCLLSLVPVFLLNWQTYGSPFSVGYLLRDNAPLTIMVTSPTATVDPSSPSWLPYGFHPRNILANSYHFIFGLLWPWLTVVVLALAVFFIDRKRKTLKNLKTYAPLVCAIWMVAYLFILYGSGQFADNLRPGAYTIGNSFIRYFLPVAALAGWAWAFLAQTVEKKYTRTRIARLSLVMLFSLLTAGLMAFGIYRSFIADEEGLAPARRELIRYAAFRQEVRARLDDTSVIFSERSDKIFFPDFQVVSPLPPFEEMVRFVKTETVTSTLYLRPLSQTDQDRWRAAGIEVTELGSSNREILYRLTPNKP